MAVADVGRQRRRPSETVAIGDGGRRRRWPSEDELERDEGIEIFFAVSACRLSDLSITSHTGIRSSSNELNEGIPKFFDNCVWLFV